MKIWGGKSEETVWWVWGRAETTSPGKELEKSQKAKASRTDSIIKG